MNNTPMFKVGDKVRLTKLIKYRFGHTLLKGTIMEIMEANKDGSYICKRPNSDSVVAYALLSHQIKHCA